MCSHWPPCPPATAPDHAAARTVVSHAAEQGWSLLCNGVVLFVDAGELLPGGRVLPARRSTGTGPLVEAGLGAGHVSTAMGSSATPPAAA